MVFLNENSKLKKKIKADAIITNQKKLPIAVLTADCVPVLLYDYEKKIIAAIHAGWKGAYRGIIRNVINFMHKKGCNPKNIIGAIGPSITQKNYEADGEIYIEINENIRGNSIFIIQSISSPANDNLMELLLCIDALKRSSAKNITAVIPYFGYARQDRKVVPRTSISAKLVSNLITQAGADRVVTVDLHAGQIQGFFDIPVDNLFATPIFARHIKKKIKSKNIICVAPDVGGTERARALGKILNIGLAIVDKRRPKPGQSQVMNIIGDVKGKRFMFILLMEY